MGTPEQPPVGDWREWRRLRAVQLRQEGWTEGAIGEALGASKGSVSRWLAVAHAHGDQALRARPRVGAPTRLTDAQKTLLPDYLWHGAEAYGFRGEVWTCARVATVIQEEFRRWLSPRPRFSALEGVAVDPANADHTGHSTRRASHPTLAR